MAVNNANGRIHGEVIIRCGMGLFAAADDDLDDGAAERKQAESLDTPAGCWGNLKGRGPKRGLLG